MLENKYSVLIGDNVIANDMSLQNAIIFVKSLFGEYYYDTNLSITIKRINDNVNSYVEEG